MYPPVPQPGFKLEASIKKKEPLLFRYETRTAATTRAFPFVGARSAYSFMDPFHNNPAKVHRWLVPTSTSLRTHFTAAQQKLEKKNYEEGRNERMLFGGRKSGNCELFRFIFRKLQLARKFKRRRGEFSWIKMLNPKNTTTLTFNLLCERILHVFPCILDLCIPNYVFFSTSIVV